MRQPKQSHFNAVLGVVRYLKNSLSAGILLSSSKNLELKAFCDLNWGTCGETKKSINGFCIMLGYSLVSWKAKK